MQAASRAFPVSGETRLLPAVIAGDVQLEEQTLSIAGRKITLVAPTQIDAVVEMYIRRGQNDRDPYWARPWPSGVAMAEFLLTRPEYVFCKRVCDLGAGLGISGIAAGMAGAEQVVLLDREPRALVCALLGAQASGLDVGEGTVIGWDGSSGSSMRTGSAPATNETSPNSDSPPPNSTPSPEARPSPPDVHFPQIPFADPCISAASSTYHPPGRGYHSTAGSSGMMAGQGASLTPLQVSAEVQQVSGLLAATSLHSGPAVGSSSLQGATAAWLGLSATAGPASHPVQILFPQPPGGVPPVVGEVFDWCAPDVRTSYDVVLASDVLYEAGNVEPVMTVLPQLLKRGGLMLLADPPSRTPHNRERFLQLLQQEMQGLRMVAVYMHDCQVGDVDEEMIAGGEKGQVIPVQILVLHWQ